MNAKRLTLVVATGLIVTGCGAAANAGGGASFSLTPAQTSAPPSATKAPSASAAPSATPPTSAPTPPPAPQVIVVADESNYSAATFEVALVTSNAHVLASTLVSQDARWTIGVGPGAAYWVTGGKLKSLNEHGVVTTLATVPSTQSGRVVLSPDGSQWAYATTTPNANSVITNRLYRGGVRRAAQLIAERTSDANHPTADAPPEWQYYPLAWTAQGILIERQPVGGCGCGTPFDMQMTAAYAAFIDPLTGAATTLGASTSCPLSGIGSDAMLACFHVTSAGTSDSLRFINGAHTIHQYALTGKSDGGDATFNGSTLAYATVPGSAGGCGGPDWRPDTTLRVMDVTTGNARIVGGTGLQPVAWMSDGRILATLSVAHRSATTSSVVAVDPLTGGVNTLFNRSFTVIGID